jgi:hypothetical protein
VIAQFAELAELLPGWFAQAMTPSGFLTVLSMVIIAILATAGFFYWDAIAAREEGRTPLHCIAKQRIYAAVTRPRNRTKRRRRRRSRSGMRRPTLRR